LSDVAVELKNICKTFRLYHEKRNTIFESLAGRFNLIKHYENLQILKNITFQVKKGESFGIIGKNGIGKTTLLRIISKIYQPDSGDVIVNGSILPFLGLGLGFHPELDAKSNIIQFGVLLGFSKKEISERISDILEFAELEKFADTKLKNFSSGMFMRLAFSTAAQIDPDVLLLDEIMYVGDLGFQKKSFDTIMSFKKRGKSIIIVSQDMGTIKNHCNRAMLLNNGEIEIIGNPDTVIQKYTDLF